MCDSKRPLNGADSEESLGQWPDDFLTYPVWSPSARTPVWPTRAANEGWDTPRRTSDSPQTPPSARALIGAGARGGE